MIPLTIYGRSVFIFQHHLTGIFLAQFDSKVAAEKKLNCLFFHCIRRCRLYLVLRARDTIDKSNDMLWPQHNAIDSDVSTSDPEE
jgi:hypothetical protein